MHRNATREATLRALPVMFSGSSIIPYSRWCSELQSMILPGHQELNATLLESAREVAPMKFYVRYAWLGPCLNGGSR